jgi:hypothetical protein
LSGMGNLATDNNDETVRNARRMIEGAQKNEKVCEKRIGWEYVNYTEL